MLEKQYRLKKNKEYNYIYRKGESVYSKVLTVYFVKTKIKPFKVGFSISSKIGNSVIRHKVKRRLTHLFKEFLDKVNPNFNYVFVARQGIENLSHEELFNEMKKVLKKGNVLVE
jgi:ribonuclease P protein component